MTTQEHGAATEASREHARLTGHHRYDTRTYYCQLGDRNSDYEADLHYSVYEWDDSPIGVNYSDTGLVVCLECQKQEEAPK